MSESYLTPSHYKLEVARFVQIWELATVNFMATRQLLLLLPSCQLFFNGATGSI